MLRFLLSLNLLFTALVCAKPQVVTLVSGERLIGEVLKTSDKKVLRLKSDIVGQVELSRSQVASVSDYEKVYDADPFVVPPASIAKKRQVRADPAKKAVSKTEPAEDEPKFFETLRGFKAPPDWSGNLRLGINFSQGDRAWTETYTKGTLVIEPKKSPHYLRFTGSYVYRETERSSGESYKSTDKANLGFTYRRTFFDDWFVQNSLTARMDQIKGINREIQETIGVGFKYEPNKKLEFLIGGGGGVEEFQTDRDDIDNGLHAVMNVFQETVWKPFDRTSFVQKFSYFWSPEDSEQYNYVLTAAVRLRLTDLLGLEFSFNKNFDNIIIDGKVRDDTQWRNALVLYF